MRAKGQSLEAQPRSRLRHVGADAEQGVQQRRVADAGGVVGHAPEQQAQHHVPPQLARHVEQAERPVAEAQHRTEQARRQRRGQARSSSRRVQRLAQWEKNKREQQKEAAKGGDDHVEGAPAAAPVAHRGEGKQEEHGARKHYPGHQERQLLHAARRDHQRVLRRVQQRVDEGHEEEEGSLGRKLLVPETRGSLSEQRGALAAQTVNHLQQDPRAGHQVEEAWRRGVSDEVSRSSQACDRHGGKCKGGSRAVACARARPHTHRGAELASRSTRQCPRRRGLRPLEDGSSNQLHLLGSVARAMPPSCALKRSYCAAQARRQV